MAVTDDRTGGRSYLLPAEFNKLKDDVLRIRAAMEAIDADIVAVLSALAQKAAITHGHDISAIAGLVSALAGKVSVGYHDSLDDLSDVSVTGAGTGQVLIRQGLGWIPVSLQVGNIANLETLLNGKASQADLTAAINGLVNGAGSAYDTLKELGDLIANDQTGLAALTIVVAAKLNTSDFVLRLATDTHAATANTTLVDADELGFWSSVANAWRKISIVNLKATMAGLFPRFDAAQAVALTQAQRGQLAANSGQAWEQIGARIDVASPLAQIVWTNLSAYRMLRLTVSGLYGTVQEIPYLQFSADNGASWINGNDHLHQFIYGQAGTPTATVVTATGMRMVISSIGTLATDAAMTTILMSEFNKAGKRTKVLTQSYASDGSGDKIVGSVGIENVADTSADNALKVFFGSGLIASGLFNLEGIRG